MCWALLEQALQQGEGRTRPDLQAAGNSDFLLSFFCLSSFGLSFDRPECSHIVELTALLFEHHERAEADHGRPVQRVRHAVRELVQRRVGRVITELQVAHEFYDDPRRLHEEGVASSCIHAYTRRVHAQREREGLALPLGVVEVDHHTVRFVGHRWDRTPQIG